MFCLFYKIFFYVTLSNALKLIPNLPTTKYSQAMSLRNARVPRHLVRSSLTQSDSEKMEIVDNLLNPILISPEDSKSAIGFSTPPRVYKPRTDISPKPNSASVSRPPARVVGSSSNNAASVILQSPQVLIRYRVPRMKSDFKIQLELLQEMYKTQFESNTGSKGTGGSGTGRSYNDPNDSTFAKFDPSALFSSDSKKSVKGKTANKDGDWKSGDSTERMKGVGDRRSKIGDDVDIEEALDEEEDDNNIISDGYYGDEDNLGLSVVPSSALREMEMEGFSLDEIQLTVYGEYGIKVSIQAIKRRLLDDKSERKGKKKTGKTRKDRVKARNARFTSKEDTGVRLPQQGLIQVQELASLIQVGSGEIVKHLMLNKGIMATMSQSIDISIAKEVVLAFGKILAIDSSEKEVMDDVVEEGVSSEAHSSRAPIVTIMGHVDHGKTSLLDTIRKSQIALGEAGGITQGISAFKVKTNQDQFVTFIDTPGHAAFSEMRKRGANVTDIVILVVAADDGVMEQTVECIVAAKSAGCPIVVAVNKIDKDGADVQGVLTQLMSYDILTEEFGGDIQCAKVSAKKGLGIQDLLDKVLLQSEIMSLKTAEGAKPEGTVIESRVDKGLGVVVTSIVQKGTLRIGDIVLAGPSWGRVRRLISDQGEDLKEAGPSTPVQIIGMSSIPNAGDYFSTTATEAEARDVAEARQRISRQAAGSASNAAIMAQATGFADGTMDKRELIKVPVVIKGDVSGSIEAIRSSLDGLKISDEESTCFADVVFAGVGDVTSSDVAIAAVSKAKILAFKVASGYNAMEEARASNVEIGYYDVVYDLLDEMEATIKTTLAPPPPGVLIGRAEILKVFKLGKAGKVAGCKVIEGSIKSESQVRVMRGKRNPIFSGKLASIRVVKDVVSEVPAGSECGVTFEEFSDFEDGDVIECFISSNSDSDE